MGPPTGGGKPSRYNPDAPTRRAWQFERFARHYSTVISLVGWAALVLIWQCALSPRPGKAGV